MQGLSNRVKEPEAKVAGLKGTLDAQSQQVHFISNQIQSAKTAENMTEVISAYPSLGQYMAGSRSGWIDPTHKEPGLTYTVLSLYLTHLTPKPAIDSKRMAQAMTVLQQNQYKVFLNSVGLYVGSSATNVGTGTQLNGQGCQFWATPATRPPCILYFNQDVSRSALRARDLLEPIQRIPSSQVVFVNSVKLKADMQELLRLSHMDMIVVLDASN